MPQSLQTAYVSLSEAIFLLLSNPELPHVTRSAILAFCLELRGNLNAEQRLRLDAIELRATLPECLGVIPQDGSSNGNRLMEAAGERLSTQMGK